jgi:uncharacterized membrane protein
MQQFPTRSSSNTPLLIAAVGVGALIAYALSSPRRRAALLEAGQSALDAGSRLASTSAGRLHELLPEGAHDSLNDFTAKARSATGNGMSIAAGKLHDAVDRASELMHEVLARARKLPIDDGPRAREQLRESADELLDSGSGRSSTRGVMIAAAAVGAGLYAMQRYGASDRLRQKIGADESGTIHVEKTLFIDAPIEQVFDTWSNYDNFPRFMSNVQSVKALDGNRSHWKVRGPAGIGVEFDSVSRQQRPNELSWQSEPGSTVQNEGQVSLVPEGSGTRATVRMSYRPPAGALGQAVSSLFGANPKQEFDEDLDRMKQFIEGRRIATTQSI